MIFLLNLLHLHVHAPTCILSLRVYIIYIFFVLELNEMIDDMATQLQEKHSIEEFSHVALPVQVRSNLCDRMLFLIENFIDFLGFIKVIQILGNACI